MSNEIARKEYSLSALKGLIGAIPYAGTLLNEILFEARSRLKQERVNSFIIDFSEYLNQYSTPEQDLSKINKDDFGDIFEEIIFSVSKTNAEHKRQIFKQILSKELSTSREDNEDKLRYISITNTISKIQFSILTNYFTNGDVYIELRNKISKQEHEIPKVKAKLLKETGYSKQGLANRMKAEQDHLIALQSRISNDRSELLSLPNPNDFKEYDLDQETFTIEIQDLLSKGLISDLSSSENGFKASEIFNLTGLSRKFIAYIGE